jgi:hypothetical protein
MEPGMAIRSMRWGIRDLSRAIPVPVTALAVGGIELGASGDPRVIGDRINAWAGTAENYMSDADA